MVCGNFILPEPASYVFFYAFFNLRKLLYIINDDTGRLVVAVALTQGVVIPTKKTTNLVGMVGGQINTSFATEAVGSKILSRYGFSSSKE